MKGGTVYSSDTTNMLTALLRWYRTHKRNLPWRWTRDPYASFVSELMLQQTQVDRVIPKYETWLKTFPTWESLAAAKTDKLIRAWAGLGYNRRALFAREAAKTVVASGIPTDEAGWRELKGVGPYMAAALAEFANHVRAIVIDTNVRRVVGRAQLGLPFPSLRDDEKVRAVLEREVPKRGNHWDIPQALMDLAASTCLPKKPKCEICPLRRTCKATKLSAFSFKLSAKPRTRPFPNERVSDGKRYPDRIFRGRILALVRTEGPVDPESVGPRVDPTYSPKDAEWVEAMIERLAKDGLLAWTKQGELRLPK